jgi:SAM-dependent methyltransferase
MRSFWESRAQANAAYYVDTSLDYDAPDMAAFFATGEVVVREALDGPVSPAGRGRAVEIGSGLGRVCRALASRFDEVVGVDISPEMVRQARALVADPRVTFVVGDGTSLAPLADGSADLVLTFTVFQHIPDATVIEGYVVEAGRILRPGGVLVAQWNNTPHATWWRLRRGVLAALQRTGLHRERRGRNASAFLGSRVSRRRMERALDVAGLELQRCRGEGGLWAWLWAVKTAPGT